MGDGRWEMGDGRANPSLCVLAALREFNFHGVSRKAAKAQKIWNRVADETSRTEMLEQVWRLVPRRITVGVRLSCSFESN